MQARPPDAQADAAPPAPPAPAAEGRFRLAAAGGAFVGGALFAGHALVPFWALASAGLAALVGAAALWRTALRRGKAPAAVSLLAASLVGAAHFRAGAPLFPLPAEQRPPPQLARIRGMVDDLPSLVVGRDVETRFTVRVEAVADGSGWRSAGQRVRLTVPGAPRLRYGDRVEALCWLRPFGPPDNPGRSDMRPAFYARGVVAAAYAASPGGVRLLERGRGSLHMRAVSAAREAVRDAIEEAMAPQEAALARCLLLGEREAVSPMQRRPFLQTGTLHFLAVSGLHVGILGWFCWAALGAAGAGRRTSALTVIVVLAAFAFVTGLRPPVVRATVMAALVCGAFALGRKPSWPASVAAAAALIVLARPGEVMAPGFRLSFAAVIGILALTLPMLTGLAQRLFPVRSPELGEPLPGWGRAAARVALSALVVSLAAWAATLPILAGQFRRMTPMAPFASLLMLPTIWAFLMTAFPGAVLAPLFPVAGKLLLRLAEASAAAMASIGNAASGLPGAAMPARPWPWLWWIAFYGALAPFALRGRTGWSLRRCAIPGLALACAATWAGALRPEAGPARIVSLRLGGGHATLVRTSEGGAVLYGGGGNYAPSAARSVVDALQWLGVRRIDLAVLPSGMASGGNALAFVGESVPVAKVVASEDAIRHAGGRLALHRFYKSGIPVRLVKSGDRVVGVPGAEIKVLAPPGNADRLTGLTGRDALCALELRLAEGSVLLAPDGGVLTGIALAEAPPVDVAVLGRAAPPPRARAALVIGSASPVADAAHATLDPDAEGGCVVTWEGGKVSGFGWGSRRTVQAPVIGGGGAE